MPLEKTSTCPELTSRPDPAWGVWFQGLETVKVGSRRLQTKGSLQPCSMWWGWTPLRLFHSPNMQPGICRSLSLEIQPFELPCQRIPLMSWGRWCGGLILLELQLWSQNSSSSSLLSPVLNLYCRPSVAGTSPTSEVNAVCLAYFLFRC